MAKFTHFLNMLIPPRGNSDEQGDFGQLRGLKIHWPEVKPPARAVELDADAGNQNQHQQHQRPDKERHRKASQNPIIN